MLAQFARKCNNDDEASRLLADALQLAERKADDAGVGLSRFNLGRLNEDRGRVTQAAADYKECLSIASRIGDFWLEAGALQQLTSIENRMTKTYTEESLTRALLVLENIYWLGAGSAPSLKVAELVDPFDAVSKLVEIVVQTKGKRGVTFVEENELLERINLKDEVRQKVRRKLRVE